MPRSDDSVKVTMTVKKTVQERQYEPYTVEITVEALIANSDEAVRIMHSDLMDDIESCFSDRRALLKKQEAENRANRKRRYEEEE